MDLDVVIASAPEIRPIEDERAQFYLDNHGLIETWAALRAEAASVLTARMLDLVEPLTTDLARLGETEVQVGTSDSRGRPSVNISRLGWHGASPESPVHISLETEPSAIGSRGNLQIFACVRARQAHPDANARRNSLDALAPHLRGAMGRGWKTTLPRYVVWKYVDAPADSWSLENLMWSAREQLLRLWSVASVELDRTMIDRAADAT